MHGEIVADSSLNGNIFRITLPAEPLHAASPSKAPPPVRRSTQRVRTPARRASSRKLLSPAKKK
jgi:hypothetical protein